MPAGSSKTTISRCGGGSTGAYATTVLAIGGVGHLRGYWRLGESVGNFADTSGYNVGDPADLTISGAGGNVRHVAGNLGPANDDGAWQITAEGPPAGGNEVAAVPHAGENPTSTILNTATIVAWIKPAAVSPAHPDYRGALLNMSSIVAGSPSYELGWGLELFYLAGATSPSLRAWRSNSAGLGGFVDAEIAGLVVGTIYMASFTFDGSTLEVGVNGATFVNVADVPRGITGTAAPQIAEGTAGMATGVIDEVSVWDVVLSHADLANLYSLGLV